MTKSRFSGVRIVGILKQVKIRLKVGDTSRKQGIRDASITSERASILGCPTPSNPAAVVARRERQAQAHVCRLGARSTSP